MSAALHYTRTSDRLKHNSNIIKKPKIRRQIGGGKKQIYIFINKKNKLDRANKDKSFNPQTPKKTLKKHGS